MVWQRIILCLISLLILPSLALADRPKVGLVLGGGGAAGVAHVGVLKVLEEQGIHVDMIAGTSMGAIVGSLYAAGYRADELEKIVQELEWMSLFQDVQARPEQAFQRKRENAGFFNTFELGIKEGAIQLPEGLISGQKLTFELRRLLARVGQVDNFDKLPIPFRAVATNIETGKQVVLSHGNLATAVRASMSIPGLFAPIKIDNQLLVDGFVSNNVPIDVVKAMGADIVIVVSLPYYFEKRENLNSAVAVTVQAMQFLTSKNSLPQLEAMKAPSVVIEPEVKNVGSLDFDKVRETIPLGEQAARKKLRELQQIAAFYPKLSAGLARAQLTQPVIDAKTMKIGKITINNDSSLNNDVIAARLGVKQGDAFDTTQLQTGLDSIHGLGYFDLVDYQLLPLENGTYNLVIDARKRSNGENRLRLGLSLEDNFSGDTRYQFGIDYIRLGVTKTGGEWRNKFIIGDDIHASSEMYHPIDANQEKFFSTKAYHNQRNIYDYQGNHRLTELRLLESGIQVEGGKNLSDSSEIRAGVFYRDLRPHLKTGSLRHDIADNDLQMTGLLVNYRYDSLDDVDFPKQGALINTEYTQGFEVLNADMAFNRLKIEAEKAVTKGRHRAVTRTEWGTTFDNNTFLTEQPALGGLGRLSGLAENQLRGNNTALGSVMYTYELTDVPKITKVYAGGSLELGNVWQNQGEMNWGNLLQSGSLFIGLDSIIGPAYIGIGHTEGYDTNFFMQVGRRF